MFLHLFVLYCELQQISTRTLSGVRFMGTINAIWSSSGGDCVIKTPRMITLEGHITWKAMFAAEPTPTNIVFLSDYYCDPRPRDPIAELGLQLAGSPRTPHYVRGVHGHFSCSQDLHTGVQCHVGDDVLAFSMLGPDLSAWHE